MNIAVLGGGTWGTALAVHLSQKYPITVWEFSEERVAFVHENKKHDLLGVSVPDTVVFTNTLDVRNADVVLVVVPSGAVKQTIQLIKGQLKSDAVVILASKGLDESGRTQYEMVKKLITHDVAVLTGPTHAEEVVHRKLSGAVIAAEKEEVAKKLQELFQTNDFVFTTSDDPIGTQLSAAVKNVLAILIGMVSGLDGTGDNAEALALTKGFHQLARVVETHGGKRESYLGLAGLGDVLVTCLSEHSRNRTFGTLIGQGKDRATAEKEVGQVVEGIRALTILYNLTEHEHKNIPVVRELHAAVFEGKPPREALNDIVS